MAKEKKTQGVSIMAQGPTEDESRQLPIEWHVPDSVQSAYANNILIQHSPYGEFIVQFFEILPPIIIGTDEQKLKTWKQLKSVQARCVARIIVKDDKMLSFVQALQTAIDGADILDTVSEEND